MKTTKATAGFRKGPWTEQEDMKLVWFLRLFGERRWDLLAKVSCLQGLRRTGKSCRLRWVNYLHPDLKRGPMSPHEERLVVDLHARWGNRWSRIAKAMPGRTDNEVKIYCRTHNRKLHKTTTSSRAAGSGSGSGSTTTSTSMSVASRSSSSTNDNAHHSQGDEETVASQEQGQGDQLLYAGTMDGHHLLWNDAIIDTYAWNGTVAADMGAAPSVMVASSSQVWDYCCSDSLWEIGDDEVKYKKMLAGTS